HPALSSILCPYTTLFRSYLSRRDSEWNGPIFEFLGLTVDCIDKHEPNSEARRNAYHADITYGTNNEFGLCLSMQSTVNPRNSKRSEEHTSELQSHLNIVC